MSERKSFQERVQKLEAQRLQQEESHWEGKTHSARAGISPIRENIRYPLSFIRAALVGCLALMISRFVRYHLTGGSLAGGQEDATVVMFVDGLIAAGAGFALKEIFAIQDKALQAAQTAGVMAMLLLMHNLVHYAPTLFVYSFSQEWVDDVLENTTPNTLLFRGVTITMGQPEGSQSEAKMPVIHNTYQSLSD